MKYISFILTFVVMFVSSSYLLSNDCPYSTLDSLLLLLGVFILCVLVSLGITIFYENWRKK